MRLSNVMYMHMSYVVVVTYGATKDMFRTYMRLEVLIDLVVVCPMRHYAFFFNRPPH